MEQARVASPVPCLVQMLDLVLFLGFAWNCLKEHQIMMMIHLLELKSGNYRGVQAWSFEV